MHMTMFLLTLLLLGGVLCDEVLIHNASELIELSESVNKGTSDYSGTTVFLDSDIVFTAELSQAFEPIGKDEYNYFLGTFDGQGYRISSLALNTSIEYAGLFGYSLGATIKNVVVDSTCSATNSFESTLYSAYIGGVLGLCSINKNSCIIENTLNMGSIAFRGNLSSNPLYIGGVVGYLAYSSSSDGYIISVKNCANYGSVVQEGTTKSSYMGELLAILVEALQQKWLAFKTASTLVSCQYQIQKVEVNI